MALVGMSARYPWQPRLPVSVGASGPVGPAYADFQAHIATLATNGNRAWSGTPAAGVWRTTAAAPTGIMAGSSWANYFLIGGVSMCRAVQHGLPSEAEFNAQVAAGREIFFRSVAGVNQSIAASVDRNGYTSQSYTGASTTTASCTELIYWTPSGVFSMNPSAGTGPTPYTW